jgi:hypothetical protein
VIQAQRDLAQAKTNELSAVLAYDLALVDFEALQQAGPAGTLLGNSGGDSGASTIQTAPAAAPAAAAPAAAQTAGGVRIGG